MSKLIIVLFLTFMLKNGYCQNLNSDNKLTQNLLLHLSKNSCTTGDVIAFKCYVINNINHTEDDNNVYIILSDKNGTIISKEKYPLFNASANGYITIPKELETGSYNVEAFTPYMINNKTIKSSKLIVTNLSKPHYNLPILCKVYYDNNKLISNLPNTFFVKTLYNNDLPTACEVYITDKDDKQIQRFTTDNNGIAKITFTPLRNQVYNLSINNKKYQYPLIKPDSIGVNMQVSFEKNVLNFMLSKNYKIPNNEDSFTVVAYQNNMEVYKSVFSFENYGSITSGLNIATLPSGIITLALVNKDKNIISSSSVYLQNDKNFEDVMFSKQTNPTSNSLHNNITFSSKANKYLSVSIEKINAKDSIMTSDFDFFYTKNTYDNSNESIIDVFEIASVNKKPLNNTYKILIPNIKTQVTKNVYPKISDDYANVIKGKVYDPTGEKLYAGGFINFSYETPDSAYNYTAKVKSDGSFTLDSLIFFGVQKFTYKYYTNDKKEFACLLKITENRNNNILDSLLVYGFNYSIKKKIADNNQLADTTVSKTKVLEEVKIKSNVKTKSKSEVVDELFTTGIYSGRSSEFIDNINNPPLDTKMRGGQFVKNRIPVLQIERGESNELRFVNSRNFSLQTGKKWVVGVTIDEIPATLTDLDFLDAGEIALVKFFDVGHASVGMINPGGLVAVYTKGNKSLSTLGKLSAKPITEKERVQEFQYEGFGNNILITNEKTGYISTDKIFYWNPSIILSKDQTSFSFDTPKIETSNTYKLNIKGYNELGKFIIIEKNLSN